jgi:hypothetical protein
VYQFAPRRLTNQNGLNDVIGGGANADTLLVDRNLLEKCA